MNRLLATTTMGLEAVCSRELDKIGYPNRIIGLGRVEFEGDQAAIIDANLWLRTAGRVLVSMDRFEAKDFGVLFDRVTELPWEQWIPADGAFPVKGRSVRSQLSSVPACQRAVKKAIVQRLMKAHGVTNLPETGPTFPVEISLVKDEASLTIDTSGTGLHKRGYRKMVGEAPLRETLAAGMLLLSFWERGRPLIDPFCGTGTIPIEAALIGRNIAPGLNRAFIAESWPVFEGDDWQRARDVARRQILPNLPERIIGTDIDEEALKLARYHAGRAGVLEDIHFQQRDFADLLSKRQYGCLVTNPPYAIRLGEESEVEALYATMPGILRRLPTWSHYILTAYPDFEKLVGQKADRRRKLYNSRIECTYYQYYGPRPPREGEVVAEAVDSEPVGRAESRAGESPEDVVPVDAIVTEEKTTEVGLPVTELEGVAEGDAQTARQEPRPTEGEKKAKRKPVPAKQAFGGLDEAAHRQAELFANRLKKRARHLRRWPTRRGITCYRLYDRDIPEVPLVVDRYGDCLHMAEYERPHDRTPAEHADWLDLMVKTAAKALDVPRQEVFMKSRRRQRGANQYERVGDVQRMLDVEEAGLKFEVNLSDYLDTGLFLDHRITRSMVRDEAEGKRFLNLFAYTGSFTVYAAAGRAKSTTTVDLSSTYLDWAARNLKLNGFREGPDHDLVRADSLEFLQDQPREPLFDLAVVDPPTFSNSKRTETDWDVQADHATLLRELIHRMSSGGVIYFSTNFRRFKLDEQSLFNVTVREISDKTVPEDFRNQRIHRCWRMVVG